MKRTLKTPNEVFLVTTQLYNLGVVPGYAHWITSSNYNRLINRLLCTDNPFDSRFSSTTIHVCSSSVLDL